MGIFNLIAIPLGWLLKIIYDVVSNYGLALLLFTLVTKIILFPLSWKQKKSSIRMAAVQPLINEVNKKYANNKTPAKVEQPTAKQTKKLSYNQKRLLEVLPKEIETLDKEIVELTTELSNPELYQQNPSRFDEASQLLELKQQEKASKEEAWLELEILAEEMSV